MDIVTNGSAEPKSVPGDTTSRLARITPLQVINPGYEDKFNSKEEADEPWLGDWAELEADPSAQPTPRTS
jgi:hypothetical protein